MDTKVHDLWSQSFVFTKKLNPIFRLLQCWGFCHSKKFSQIDESHFLAFLAMAISSTFFIKFRSEACFISQYTPLPI